LAPVHKRDVHVHHKRRVQSTQGSVAISPTCADTRGGHRFEPAKTRFARGHASFGYFRKEKRESGPQPCLETNPAMQPTKRTAHSHQFPRADICREQEPRAAKERTAPIATAADRRTQPPYCGDRAGPSLPDAPTAAADPNIPFLAGGATTIRTRRRWWGRPGNGSADVPCRTARPSWRHGR